MNTRIKLSAVLLMTGFILAVLPYSGNRSLAGDPGTVLAGSLEENSVFTADQVAGFIAGDDSTIRLVDLRSPQEFSRMSLPGAVNVPYSDFLKNDPSSFLAGDDSKNILISDDDLLSAYAIVLARGMNYNNIYVMKGGMNEWVNTVMNTSFTGERITPRENALFETRTKAKRLFNEFNSLPDSLKASLLASKKLEARKLDGGCE